MITTSGVTATQRISGQRAELKMRLGVKDGRTVIIGAFNTGPLKIAKPFYLEPETGGIYLCQMCTGGGLAQGDDYRQEIDVGPGACVFLTTQASTKIYRMEDSFARQVNVFKVAEGAIFEYLPEPLVPFSGSRYVGETEVFLTGRATAFLGEIITPGRATRGEVFEFDYYNSVTRVYWDDELVFWNNQMLNAQSGLSRLGLYDGYTHQGSFLIFSEKVNQDLADRLHDLLAGRPDIMASASLTLKNGIAVRLLGNRASHLEEAIYNCWGLARWQITGLPPLNLRKVGS